MVDFILHGLTRPVRTANRECKIETSCPQWDSNPGPSAYEDDLLSVVLLYEIYTKHLNVDRVLPACMLKSTCTMYHVVDVELFCRVLHFMNSLQSASVLSVKQRNDTNII